VTFAVPVYNGAVYLGETLASLLAQTADGYRVVVVDNVSTDASAELAESFADPRLDVVRATEHVSMTENWNRAVALVDTEYLVLAHADDVYEPDYLATMLPLIERFPKAFLAHCLISTIDEHSREIASPNDRYKERFWPPEDPYERGSCEALGWLARGNYISPPSPIFRTSAVREIGPFETRYLFVPDWAFWAAGVLAGFTIVGTRRRLVRYRRHTQMLSKALYASKRSFREEIELLKWFSEMGRAAGCPGGGRADYGLVANTVSSAFAELLGSGDRQAAHDLLEFARAEIPGFRGGARDLVLRGALATGPAGGRALARARDVYLSRIKG
jgi:glycosyltransferase involved in cell wall biosynthesis